MPDFAEGDHVTVSHTGRVLWIGDRHFEVDEMVYDLALLQHPDFKVEKQ